MKNNYKHLSFLLFLVLTVFSPLIAAEKTEENKLIFKPYKNVIKNEHVVQTQVEKDETSSNNINDDEILGKIIFLDIFECKNLVYKRGIFVWFPENYSKSSGLYSVIYFHDAQNLFLPSKSFSGYDWKVDETISKLRQNLSIKPCIVVGIPNSPKRDEELNIETKEGKAYADFIIKEVIPLIKNKFSVSKKREDHIIAGSSMGGLMSFQMAFNYPNLFGGAICMSSAFHRSISNIISQVEKSYNPPLNVKFYIDAGEKETDKHDNEDILSLCNEMTSVMKKKGYREDINLKSYIHKKGKHNEKSWAERLDIPLKFLLGK